jgi:hypothetical protein
MVLGPATGAGWAVRLIFAERGIDFLDFEVNAAYNRLEPRILRPAAIWIGASEFPTEGIS